MMRAAMILFVFLTMFVLATGFSLAQEQTAEPTLEAQTVVPTPQSGGESPVPLATRSNFNASNILSEISLGYVVLLVISAALGGLGGFGAELMGSTEQDVEMPGARTAANRIDIGFWARVILGAISAIIALYLIGPQDLITYIAVSLLGGVFGTSALKLVEGRFLASLAGERARNEQLRDTIINSQQQTQDMLAQIQRAQPGDAAAAEAIASDIPAIREGLLRLDAILENELKRDKNNGS